VGHDSMVRPVRWVYQAKRPVSGKDPGAP
jgi:hypothetical protein